MNIIHIGLGTTGRRWFELTRKHPGCTSVACVDVDPSATASAMGAVTYSSLDDCLKNSRADVALVSTPLPVRAAHAVAALDAGLTVMIAAPFAGDVAEAADVFEAARRNGRRIVVATDQWSVPNEPALCDLVRQGVAGRVTHVSCVDRRTPPPAAGPSTRGRHSQLRQAGTRHLAGLRRMLGVNPLAVMARTTKAPWSLYEHGSTTEIVLEMERETRVQYHGSLTSNRNEYSIWIEGDQGVLWSDGRYLWWRKRGRPVFLPMLGHSLRAGSQTPPAGWFDRLKAATSEANSAGVFEDGDLWTVAMFAAAVRSDESGQTIRLANLLESSGFREFSPSITQDAQ